MREINHNSFQRGYKRLPNGVVRDFKQKVMKKFDLTESSFYRRMSGDVPNSRAESIWLEGLFLKYGVKKSEIWGKDEGSKRETD